MRRAETATLTWADYRAEFPIFESTTYLNTCSLAPLSRPAPAGGGVPAPLAAVRRLRLVRAVVGGDRDAAASRGAGHRRRPIRGGALSPCDPRARRRRPP